MNKNLLERLSSVSQMQNKFLPEIYTVLLQIRNQFANDHFVARQNDLELK
jgi:hypothetical protein